MNQKRTIDCPRCNKIFECKLDSIQTCHCSKVLLTKEEKSYIAENWHDCLCHQCLVEITKTKQFKDG